MWIYNISKFQAKSQSTDAGWGIAISGGWGLRKHAKTPCGHPSTHVSNWVILDKFTFMSITSCALVFSSPVQSSFLTSKGATVDRNWSQPLPKLGEPQLNQIGPVLFGSVAPKDQFQLVPTTIFTVNKLYYKSIYISGGSSLNNRSCWCCVVVHQPHINLLIIKNKLTIKHICAWGPNDWGT